MEMRKFIIELHPDGRMTWAEYEDPQSNAHRDSKAAVARNAYNQALRDVLPLLEAAKARCLNDSENRKSGQGWATFYVECELIEAAIAKLFRKS